MPLSGRFDHRDAPSEAWREGLVVEMLPPKRGEREKSWRICAVVVVSSKDLSPKRGERESNITCIDTACTLFVILRTHR